MVEKVATNRVQAFGAWLEGRLPVEQRFDMSEFTSEEYYGCATICLQRAEEIGGIAHRAVDLVGTGGGRFSTFNISTTASFIAAGAGVSLVKQTGVAVTGSVGSIDLLHALQIPLKKTPEGVIEQFDRYGLSFVSAAYFHPKLQYLDAVSRAALMPFIHPACITRKAVGVNLPEHVSVYADVLKKQGVKRAIVFHGNGTDELSLTGENTIEFLNHGAIEKITLSAKDTRLTACRAEDLVGDDAQDNAYLVHALLSCQLMGPKRDTVILNAAAAIYVGYPEVISLFDAIDLAQESLESGAALKCLHALQRDK